MTTFTSEDRESAKLVEEAPYHPGYEDAVVYPTVIVDSGASVDDREDSMQMLRDQLHIQQCEINALRKALMYAHPLRELTDADAEKAFLEWEKTETFSISVIEHHGFINGFRCAIAELKKDQEK